MPPPFDEVGRLAALRELEILDTAADLEFDALATAASLVCGVPISLLSLIDEKRQWFKANVGLPGASETSRDVAFCDHAIRGDEVMEVPDATADPRFAANPLVVGGPAIRFYAGAPVRLSNGHAVGTLCVIDRRPMALDDRQREILRCLAATAGRAIEGWRARKLLERTQRDLQREHAALATSTAALSRAEWQSRENAVRLTKVLAAMSEGVILLDATNEVQVCNGRAVELLNPNPSGGAAPSWTVEDGSLDWLDQAPPHLVAQIKAAVMHADPGVTRHRRSDGRLLEIRTTKLSYGGLLHTVVDVTDQDAAEQMRAERDAADQALRAKSEFLATMSHEIRSPISGLVGVLDLLRATELDAEQSRMAGMIHSSAGMLLGVLNDILDFSKIEAGALSVTLAPTRLPELIDDVMQPHRVTARHKKVGLDLVLDPNLPAWIQTDSLRLRQIIGNLLSNAVKFTAVGTISLRVTTEATGDGPMLRCAVTDSGIGMSQEVQARLFQPFMQAEGSTTRRFGGTGLGLSISQKLAHLLEGSLSVSSTPNVGSTFTLLVPCRPCAAPPLSAEAKTSVPAAPAAKGRRALVVDDDPTLRWLSQRQLEKLGLLVDVARDGDEGLARLEQEPYDLLVTDCHMPRLDGVALTRAVRAMADPRLRHIPIIGLTADVTEQQRQMCQQAGMTDLAIKPLTMDRLAALLRRHVPVAVTIPAAPEPPALRPVAFDDQIYLSIFTPGDPEGAAWIDTYLQSARDDDRVLAGLLADPGRIEDHRADIKRIAHRLAGASFSVGAIKLGHAAGALDRAAMIDDATSLLGLQRTLHAAFTAADAALRGFLKAPVAT